MSTLITAGLIAIIVIVTISLDIMIAGLIAIFVISFIWGWRAAGRDNPTW